MTLEEVKEVGAYSFYYKEGVEHEGAQGVVENTAVFFVALVAFGVVLEDPQPVEKEAAVDESS